MDRINAGDIFQDRYQIQHKLSQGGFGVVFKAKQLTTGQPVAIKCLRSPLRDGAHGDEYLNRFRREMRMCAQLHHPNIVRLIDSGEIATELIYTVFEFIPGRDLAQILAAEQQLSPQEAGYLMGQVLDALSCAHEAGIVHRDLKPANIMIAHTGARRNAQVLDFGIAAVIEAGTATAALTPSPLERVGTPAYAAPEQLRGNSATAQADLYAWGLVFLECLTGQRVVDGDSVADIIYRQLEPGPIDIPAALNGHPLADLLRLVTAKDVSQRKITAKGALEALEACDLTTVAVPAATTGTGPITPGLRSLATDTNAVTINAVSNHVAETGSSRLYQTPDTLLHQHGEPVVTPAFQAAPEGERRQITAVAYVLRVTASGSRSLDIEEQAEILAEYKVLCRERLERSGAYVVSNLGNCISAFYGYPRARADDAQRAVETGLAIARVIHTRSAVLDPRRGIGVDLQIGVHTGLVLVRRQSGNVDPSDVFGDTPNVAARICEQIAPGELAITGATRRLVRSAFAFGRSIPWPSAAVPAETGTSELSTGELVVVKGPRQAASGMGLPGSGPIEEQTSLVGRTEELALLERYWILAQEGRGQTVFVSGEAGIGKTRLTRELAVRIDQEQNSWLECRCTPNTQNSALAPVVALLDRRLDYHTALTGCDRAHSLEALLSHYRFTPDEAMPLLAPLLDVPLAERFTPLAVAPARRRELAMRALIALLVEIAHEQPMLFVVEDLHWADPSTIELLSQLIDIVPSAPICAVLTARPEFEPPWGRQPITRIPLGRLNHSGASAMITRVTGGRVLPDTVRAQVIQRTDGVPLFIEELTRSLIESGVVRAHGERYVLSEPLDTRVIPLTLRDSLMARLDNLPVPAKATAQLAAVLGREFVFAQLAAVSPLDDQALQGALDALVTAELVYRRRRITGSIYTFKHALIQETAYDSLPKRSRQRWHTAIAQTLEAQFPALATSHPEVLMHHCACAELWAQAIDYAVCAGRAALQRSANAEAQAYAELGLSWLPQLDDPARRIDAELSLNAISAPTMMANYGYSSPEFRALMARSQELVERAGDTEDAFVACWGLFAYHFARAEHERAGVVADRYLERAQRAGDTGQQVNALILTGISRYYRARFIEACQALARAVELFDPAVHYDHARKFGYDTKCLAAGYLGLVLWILGYPEQGRSHLEHAVKRAEMLKHPLSIILARFLLAKVEQREGHHQATSEVAAQICEIAKDAGLPRWITVGILLKSWAEEDLTSGEESLACFDVSGHLLRRTYWNSLIADTEAAGQQLDAAIARLDICLREAHERSEFSHLTRILWRKGELLASRGNEHSAEACLDQAGAMARAQEARMLELQATTAMARLLGANGRRAEARARLQDIVDWFTEGFNSTPLREARAVLADLA